MSQEKNWVQQPKGEGGGEGGDYNPTWSPQEMPTIEGVLTGSRLNVGKFKKTVYDIRSDDGITYSVWGTTVLDKQMASIAFNSYIKIQYLGKKQGKGNAYHDYDVFVAGESAPQPIAATGTGVGAAAPTPVAEVPAVAQPAPAVEQSAPAAETAPTVQDGLTDVPPAADDQGSVPF